MSGAVVWFRRDLRLQDNPAWAAATACGGPVTALFILDPVVLARAGTHRQALLFHHLGALDRSLAELGGRLLVEAGDPVDLVPAVAARSGGSRVFANADVSPYARTRDDAVRQRLGDRFERWWGVLVHPPGSCTAAAGHTSRVFTPFFRRWQQRRPSRWPNPVSVEVVDDPGQGIPRPRSEPFQSAGECGAHQRLSAFDDLVDDYQEGRDRLAGAGSSMLSADLHFGTISARRVIATLGDHTAGRSAFVRQLAWRDWYAHLLYEIPSLVNHALRPQFDRLAWVDEPDDLRAWEEGRTGYPVIDAAMRQLSAVGWMHNRARMLCASFLVKDLLVDWRHGERWFRRKLIDADVAQNVGNWQWAAGTGPDAAPYFRVFNPVVQAKKFDPDGAFVRRYVPELTRLPDRWIHEPWLAPDDALARAGVVLGDTYPLPIIEHGFARQRALDLYQAARA